MSIRVNHKDWKNESFRTTVLGVAELLGEDIEISIPKTKFKPFNVQIWRNDDVILEKNFLTKSDAMKYTKKVLNMKKYKDSYADMKKYNKTNDDFDWWFFKNIDGKVQEVESL